jgi:hypothetical protein
MSWLYSQALVEEYSEATCSDGEPSAQLNVMPTPHKFWRNDKTMEFSDLSRFGLTCAVLTESRGEELLMLYRAGFPARTSASQGAERELMESAADSGRNSSESFAKWDQAKSMWKIRQHSLFEDLEQSLEIWPRWGFLVDGECFHAQRLAEFTYVSESGFMLPTTGANEGKGSSKARYLNSPGFHGAKMSEGLRTCETDWTYLNPLFAELTMMWPSGWTDLKPLAMDKFQEWQQQHSAFLGPVERKDEDA